MFAALFISAGERRQNWEKHTAAAGLNCYRTTESLPVMEPSLRGHGNACDPGAGGGR